MVEESAGFWHTCCVVPSRPHQPFERSIEMLVLSRKAKESLIISNNIEVVVLGIRHGVVRIGINAPRHVSVVRSELCEAKSTVDPPQVNPDPIRVASGSPQIPLTDALSDCLLHNFCERRRSPADFSASSRLLDRTDFAKVTSCQQSKTNYKVSMDRR